MSSLDDSLTPDLNGTLCAAADCGQVADVMRTVVLEIDAIYGFPDPITRLEVAICMDHAHKTRGELTLLGLGGS